jgi:hypothetical protein
MAQQFRGRRNIHRVVLYDIICALWTKVLGQKLRYSRSPVDGTPYGPLIRFFSACAKWAMGADTPNAHGIASIIDRHRDWQNARKRKASAK